MSFILQITKVEMNVSGLLLLYKMLGRLSIRIQFTTNSNIIVFIGTFDQSYIPHAIAYSACLGEHRLRCQGLDNYTGAPLVPHSGNCAQQEITSVAHSGQPIVIASSVMSDDGLLRVKSSSDAVVLEMFELTVVVTIVGVIGAVIT